MRDFIASQNSERLRQRLSRGIKLQEPPAFTKLARSLFDMALVTGIVARLYRALVLSRADSPTGTYVVGTFSSGAFFVLMIPVIAGFGSRLRDSSRARGGRVGVVPYAVGLVVLTLQHAERVGEALRARGVDD